MRQRLPAPLPAGDYPWFAGSVVRARSFVKRPICYARDSRSQIRGGTSMRYPSTHKEETRKKLIGSARAIAKRGGFGTTGVDELMASIGLTGGAFYGHFPGKEALFAVLVDQALANSAGMLAGDESSPPDHVA